MKKIKILKTVVVLFLLSWLFSASMSFFRRTYFQKQGKILQEKWNLEKSEQQIENEIQPNVCKNGSIGILKIPSIHLEAPIYEGTQQDVLKYAIRSF